jgi:hypothetical protein
MFMRMTYTGQTERGATGPVRACVSMLATLNTPGLFRQNDERLIAIKEPASRLKEDVGVSEFFESEMEVVREHSSVSKALSNLDLHARPELEVLWVVPGVDFFKPTAKVVMVIRVHDDGLTPLPCRGVREPGSATVELSGHIGVAHEPPLEANVRTVSLVMARRLPEIENVVNKLRLGTKVVKNSSISEGESVSPFAH